MTNYQTSVEQASDDENESFIELVNSGQVPLMPSRNAPPPTTKSNVQHRVFRDLIPQDYDGLECTDAVWQLAGFSSQKLKALSKAHPGMTVDFHGDNVAQAWNRLDAALRGAFEQNIKVVELIHGKGEGILLRKIRAWLKHSRAIVAFTEVRHNSGSVVAQLKSSAKF